MGALDPGKGDRTALERRVSRIERLLAQLSPQRVGVTDVFGEDVTVKVLATPPMPDSSPKLPFILGRHKKGATVGYGELIASATLIGIGRISAGGSDINQFTHSDDVAPVATYAPSNIETDREKNTELGWFGDVWLYWEMSQEGEFSEVKLRGPEEPDTTPLPGLHEVSGFLVRDATSGSYAVKIGHVPKKGRIEQNLTAVSFHAVIATFGCG